MSPSLTGVSMGTGVGVSQAGGGLLISDDFEAPAVQAGCLSWPPPKSLGLKTMVLNSFGVMPTGGRGWSRGGENNRVRGVTVGADQTQVLAKWAAV